MLNKLIRKLARKRSETVVERIFPYIKNSKKIIDIGSGTGDIANLLIKRGKSVVPIDVGSFHGPRLVKTVIFDGKTLPFPNQSFDTALLLMVMHHTPNPTQVFSEAARVAKEIVVIETSYEDTIGKILTVIIDTLSNLQIKANWRSYKTDKDWRIFFTNNKFRIADTYRYKDRNFGIPFLHILYHLKKL